MGLPIDTFKEKILSLGNPFVIVTADTGSGKSTQICRWLRKQGRTVLITEPLIETTLGTAEFVADQEGVPLGKEVGYRTADYKKSGAETEVLFCTDGLALVRSLAGEGRFDILILDEIHQWNLNQEVLVAWVKKTMGEGICPFRQVYVLSATMDAEGLSKFLGNAPVIRVPGRQYPIEHREPGPSLVHDIVSLVKEGWDVLAFLPGKAEIEEVIAQLKEYNLPQEILSFYGGMDRKDKNRVYRSYPQGKIIVSTNALETGRTVPPSEGRKGLAIVDSGLEKQFRFIDGVESLVLQDISEAQKSQRAGRTGRLGKGVAISHGNPSTEYPTPEIKRSDLTRTALKLASAGFKMAEMPFYNAPNKDEIERAIKTLKGLGAISPEGDITPLGRKMERLPLKPSYARMVVAAIENGCLDAVITIAAILETGSLKDRRGPWRKALSKDLNSDLLAELELFRLAEKSNKREMREMGIFVRNFFLAKQLKAKIKKALRYQGVYNGGNGDSQAILKSCLVGMPTGIFHLSWRYYESADGDDYSLDRDSVVKRGSKWVIGVPRRIGRKSFLSFVTPTTKEELVKTFPGLVHEGPSGKDGYYPKIGGYNLYQKSIQGEILEYFKKPCSDPLRVGDHFFSWLKEQGETQPHLKEAIEAYKASISFADRIRGYTGDNKALSQYSSNFWSSFLEGKEIKPASELKAEQVVPPSISREEREKWEKKFPSHIEICGRKFNLEYTDGEPWVSLPKDFLLGCSIDELPRELKTPEGKKVDALIGCSVSSDLHATKIRLHEIQKEEWIDEARKEYEVEYETTLSEEWITRLKKEYQVGYFPQKWYLGLKSEWSCGTLYHSLVLWKEKQDAEEMTKKSLCVIKKTDFFTPKWEELHNEYFPPVEEEEEEKEEVNPLDALKKAWGC